MCVPPEDHPDLFIDVLDLGGYADVGMIATNTEGLPIKDNRKLTISQIRGDHTATVHIEPNMWLNIDFQSSAVLTFNVKLYEVPKPVA